MITAFSAFVMNDIGSYVFVHGVTWMYPLYNTIENISDVETKNLWLAYWIFFIAYDKMFMLDVGWSLYKQIEIVLFYIVVRYKYPKRVLFDFVQNIHLNQSGNIVDVVKKYIHDICIHVRLVVEKLTVIQ